MILEFIGAGVAAILAMTAPVQGPAAKACYAMIKTGDRDYKFAQMPGFDLLHAGRGGAMPRLPKTVGAILCRRPSIVPDAKDDGIMAQYSRPFFINALGRLGVLEAGDGGQLRFRMVSGALTPDEDAQVKARLAEFQARLKSPMPATAKPSN